jgi:hypothetical protein
LPERPQSDIKRNRLVYSFLQPVPAVYIAYDRAALFGCEDTDLRVTFDTGIRYRESMLGLDRGDWGEPLLGPDQVLMEIKQSDPMPLWLSRLLAELGIYPNSFSKYGVCYLDHLLRPAAGRGGMGCA